MDKTVDNDIQTQIYGTYAVIGTVLILCIGMAGMGASPQKLWVVLGQFQMFILLLLTSAYVPKNVADYLLGMDYAMFSFQFF